MRLATTVVAACLPILAWAADETADVDSGVQTFLDGAAAVIQGAAEAQAASPEPPAPSRGALVLTADRCAELALAQNAQAYIAEAKVAAARARTGQAAAARDNLRDRKRHGPRGTGGPVTGRPLARARLVGGPAEGDVRLRVGRTVHFDLVQVEVTRAAQPDADEARLLAL